MNDTKEVATRESNAVQQAKEQERTIRPAVDIFEDDTGITVHADMPGVSKDRLNIQIDSDSLSIMGDINIPMPENMDAVYADVRSNRYQRSFSLSRELDGDNIEASLKDGVLTLRIPKHEEHKPRKIEVRTD
ncbi:MAG: Hsp20/alpha crystallin family protein [Gammaproteobacteria bacterium]|jgi:HSP20 family molecular chaperone IbpA